MRIEPFQDCDLPALTALWVQSWQEVFPDIDFVARQDWFAAHVSAWLAAGKLCHVAKVGEGEDGLSGFHMLDPSTGHLEQLCVANSAKGQGVAASLMQDCKTLCPMGLHLDVNADNVRAIAFYTRHGFVQTGAGINPASGLATQSMAWS